MDGKQKNTIVASEESIISDTLFEQMGSVILGDLNYFDFLLNLKQENRTISSLRQERKKDNLSLVGRCKLRNALWLKEFDGGGWNNVKTEHVKIILEHIFNNRFGIDDDALEKIRNINYKNQVQHKCNINDIFKEPVATCYNALMRYTAIVLASYFGQYLCTYLGRNENGFDTVFNEKCCTIYLSEETAAMAEVVIIDEYQNMESTIKIDERFEVLSIVEFLNDSYTQRKKIAIYEESVDEFKEYVAKHRSIEDDIFTICEFKCYISSRVPTFDITKRSKRDSIKVLHNI